MELDGFFAALSGHHCEMPSLTAQAFSKARNKVRPEAFKALNQALQQQLVKLDLVPSTWHGMRLLAVDGSQCHLPLEDVQAQFYGARLEGQQPVARLSSLYDVLNKQILDAELGPDATCERSYAQSHLQHAPANSLILFDRGYPAHWLFVDFQCRKHQAVMRLPVGFNKAVKQFIASDEVEGETLLKATSAMSRALCQQSGVDPDASVPLRLIKVILDNCTVEVLATSLLDQTAYPTSLFKDLYHLRWGVETDYLRLKQTHDLENFSGRTPQAVQQDYQAHILLKNVVSLLSSLSQPSVDKRHSASKYRWQPNYTSALSRMKNTFIRLLVKPCEMMLTGLLQCIVHCVGAIRPQRSKPRKRRRPGTRGCEGYKRTR